MEVGEVQAIDTEKGTIGRRSDSNMDELAEKGYDATEGKGLDGEQNEARFVINDSTELSIVPERNSFEEEIAATQINEADASHITDEIEDVKTLASQGNDTLYIGNICKRWTKELVLGALKSYGVENTEEILLPGDTKKEGRIKGFALLEFNTHSDAMAAFERLRKSDVVFGLDSSANVDFAKTPIHPNQEVLSQLKTVFMEALADSWNQEKVKGICKQYGEITKVKLSRIPGTKGKNFGYITFVSQESALACVDQINNTQIGEGEIKVVKASIAQPHSKGRLEKRGKKNRVVQTTKEESERVNKAGSSEMTVHAKSERARRKGKILSEPESGGGKPNKSRTVTEGSKPLRAPSKVESTNQKRSKGNTHAGDNVKKGSEHVHKRNPSKKEQGNKRRRERGDFRKSTRDPYIRKETDHGADFVMYKDRHAPGYPGSAVGHQNQAYNTISGSKRPYTDMEPHAGYIDSVSRKQGRTYPEYLKPPVGVEYPSRLGYLEHAVGTQSQPRIRFHEPDFGTQSRPRGGYNEPVVGMHSHQSYTGYLEPVVRRQGQSHAGYYEYAPGKDSQSSYDLTLRRAGGHDGHDGGHSAYGTGSALPPSYVPIYTSYAPYEGGSSVGAHYQSSGVRVLYR